MGTEARTGERIEIDLGAPPPQVYEAIATADGVRSWWTDRRTRLEFAHEGLAGLGCEEMCTKGWDHYIRISLRGLVEAGEGAPGAGAGSRSE